MNKKEKYDRGSSGVHSIIGEGSSFEGNIDVDGSLRIDGVFKGTVKCDAFYVGRAADVTAEIQANMSVVGGKIKGNLVSPIQVVVEETAQIIGDVTTESISVAEKAVIHGKVDMGKAEIYKNRFNELGGGKQQSAPAPAQQPKVEAAPEKEAEKKK